MLDNIKLRFGDSKCSNLDFSPQSVNVIVGPNNSGKSLLLREILQVLNSFENLEFSIVDEIKLRSFSKEEITNIINLHKKRDIHNMDNYSISILGSNGYPTHTINEETFYSAFESYNANDAYLKQFITSFLAGQSTLLLNGQTRLNSLAWKEYSTQPQLSENYNNTVNKIINDDQLYEKLGSYIHDAFNVYPEINIDGSRARIVLSKSKIPEHLRLSVKQEATEFFEKAQNEENTSDGRKAYIGIISEIIAGNPNIILLDEPEAFLHPPLARKLGSFMSKIAIEEKKQLFVSTHSSDFIMGCIEAHVPINIIRLTYDNGNAIAKLLDNESLSKMMKNPLLRSTNVLDGIFYKNVIVTESDSDRVFYQEINKRLKEFKPEWYIEDCLFLNAQNKQTVGWITEELRKIGIPTVSIVDLDLIKDGGTNFTNYLKSVNIPKNQFPGICSNRDSIKQLYPDIEKKNSVLKTQGINYLDSDNKPLLENFLNSMNTYGLYPVPCGELESWLSNIPTTGHGNEWITSKFDLMGDNPESDSYIKPSDDDIWFFFKQIKDWLDNPERRGM
ncbi:energy-coupling factor transporter ATP-binding protein EcfA2 [Cytobacillus horneckiae]|uniref:ATP-dependent nuclease n=1 Tax=Cytobacillus horneckiae TaxID=549687 RepID=UPI0019D0ABBE|nr:ATP-binding protein [Cytobacillus horneckiae]MBN6886220.1 AAA family ATPase [Cytobacillus horneckiae]